MVSVNKGQISANPIPGLGAFTPKDFDLGVVLFWIPSYRSRQMAYSKVKWSERMSRLKTSETSAYTQSPILNLLSHITHALLLIIGTPL